MPNPPTATPGRGHRRARAADPSARSRADDMVALARESRGRPRSWGALPRLVVDAFAFVWAAASRELRWVVVLTVGTSVLAVGQIFVAREALAALLGSGQSGRPTGTVVGWVLVLAAVSAVLSSSSAVLRQRERLVSQLVNRETSRRVFDVTTRVPLSAYEGAKFYDHLTRVQTHGLSRPYELARGVLNLISGLLTSAFVIVAVWLIDPLLLPVLLVTGIPIYVVGRSNARSEFDFAVGQSANFRERAFLARVLTARESANEVRAFDLSAALRGRWEDRYGEYLASLTREVNRRTVRTVLGGVLSGLLGVAAVGLLLALVSAGRVSLPAAGAAIVALRLLTSRLQQSASGVGAIYETRLFLEDFQTFLATQQEPAGTPQQQRAAAPLKDFRSLAVRGVSFRYPGADRLALDGVDLDIGAGEVVALVGENGSGKTTLASLLARLYEPTSGSISWDGVDVGRFDPVVMRKRVAVIFQDYVRYPLSARENIGVGRIDAIDDLDGIRVAAENAGASEFLEALPHGYDTLLNKAFEQGHDLSAGQWQRMAIARAFFRDAPFVILDEPTSSLDPRAEHDLFTRIRDLLQARTVLLISHRFSTVRSADRIYVLQRGRIVEHGNHDELMATRGLYQELFDLQASSILEGRVRPGSLSSRAADDAGARS